jgi:hypothetical protein
LALWSLPSGACVLPPEGPLTVDLALERLASLSTESWSEYFVDICMYSLI